MQQILALMNVGGEVLGQIVGSGKALSAHLAVIGPLACVDPEMPREVALTPECPSAKQTNKRPLSRVLSHVEL